MDNNLSEGLRWLGQAEADLKTCRDCLTDENYYTSAFFRQQAADKGLDGFLSSNWNSFMNHWESQSFGPI